MLLGKILCRCCCCITLPVTQWSRALKQVSVTSVRFYLWSLLLGQIVEICALLALGPAGVHADIPRYLGDLDADFYRRIQLQEDISDPTATDKVFTLALHGMSLALSSVRLFLQLTSATRAVTPALTQEAYEKINRFWTDKIEAVVHWLSLGIVKISNWCTTLIYELILDFIGKEYRQSITSNPLLGAACRLAVFVILLFMVSKTPSMFTKCSVSKRRGRTRHQEEDEDDDETERDSSDHTLDTEGKRGRSAPPPTQKKEVRRGRSMSRGAAKD